MKYILGLSAFFFVWAALYAAADGLEGADLLATEYYSAFDERTTCGILRHDVHYSYKDGVLIQKVRIAFRVFTDEGGDMTTLPVEFTKDGSVEKVRGWHFNSTGSLVQKLKRKNKLKTGFSANFHDDLSQLILSFPRVKKGDTVIYQYTVKEKVLFPQIVEPMAGTMEIMNKSVTVPSTAKVQILQDKLRVISRHGNTYSVHKQRALRDEPFTAPIGDRMPLLGISFSDSFHTWSDFSSYYYGLYKEHSTISDSIVAKVVPNQREPKEKIIRQVVDYIRNNIHYIDIELGRGSYIPSTPKWVFNKKYGDCKDMVNIGVALLNAQGIHAFPVLARTADFGSVNPEFVGNQFNHMILGIEVPETAKEFSTCNYQGRPICLVDLTNPYIPIPLAGEGLEDTWVLPIFPQNATILHIPRSNRAIHRVRYAIECELQEDRTLKGTLKEIKYGYFAVREKNFIDTLDTRSKRDNYFRWCEQLLPGATLSHYQVTKGKEVTTAISFIVPSFGFEAGELLVIPINIIDSQRKALRYTSERSISTYYLPLLSKESVEVSLRLPSSLKIVTLPAEVADDNPFFSYHFTSSREAEKVTIEKKIEWKMKEIPASQWDEYKKKYNLYLRKVKAPLMLRLK